MVMKFKEFMIQKLANEDSRDSIIIMSLAFAVFTFMIWSILYSA